MSAITRYLEDVKYLKSKGFSRVVVAREMSLEEVKAIKEACDIELEVYFRYNNESDKDRIGFTNITESFIGKEYRYVIGTVSLQRLYDIRDELFEIDGFLIKI